MRIRFFPASCFTLLVLASGCAAQSTPREPILAFKQDADDLDEVSGVAVIRSQPALLWMHNDSGDSARLFAVNTKGKIALTVNLEGAAALDWEDMDAQKQWVYVGDIGDNFKFRADVQIYRFKTPTIAAGAKKQVLNLSTAQWQKTTVRFPDGPHNCESLAVTPDGRLLLVTKEESGVSGFYVWNTAWRSGASVTLSKLGAWQFGKAGKREALATGADFSSNGRKLVVTTYKDLYEFPLGRSFNFSSLQFKPEQQSLPDQKQCEAVCYSLDGRTIYSTGEGEHAEVWTLPSKLK
ncbi:hypothetical protein IAD21_03123 [Abditibacteriota bacterium]|nr:hypothetical protein IAD21_03123 [Abditibacteriota bacterium]